jgi:hypothetical protein
MIDARLLSTYEVFDYTTDTIKESIEKNGGKILMKGILQKADTLNQNGRIYPLSVLEREVRNYQKFIVENRAMGELDHPDTSVVNLKNASHVVREAYIENGTVFGTIEILDKTPSGAILKGLIESGVKLGISSRGVGSTRKQGDYYVVQDDFQLICWDMVSEPSTPGAFMLPEGKQISTAELNALFNKTDRIDRIINDILNHKIST